MAWELVIGREGSYGTNMCNLYIDDATLNNTTQFTSQIWGGGTSRNFIKPVGIYYISNGTTYMSAYGYNGGNNSVAKSENGGGTKYYHTTGIGFSFGVEKTVTFQEVIPFFNNEADASNYSLGLEFDESNWVGGKPLTPPVVPTTSNGGGATHIAKVTGQLKDLSSNLSDILMVSGGGGGGLLVGETAYTGKEAGGISGSGDNSADQTTGNAFGLGESGTNLSGGGSGLYGGYKGTSSKSGGAGSGYIGNSLLSNKKMIGYNVPTSSAEGTKTESVNVFDSNYVANKPKVGNGHARIRLLSEAKILLNNAQSPMYLDEAIDTSAEWYKYNNFDIRSNYLGQDVLSNTNCFMSSENTISSVGFKYLYVTAENTGGSGVNHHAFVCVSEQKITAWLDCYNARHCESFETNDVVETYRVQVDDLAYTDLHITLFGSDSCFKVYKMWFGN